MKSNDQAVAPPPPAPAMKAVSAWAAEKRTDAFALAGALGMKRASRAWNLHSEPVVSESEFDGAVAAFTNLSLG